MCMFLGEVMLMTALFHLSSVSVRVQQCVWLYFWILFHTLLCLSCQLSLLLLQTKSWN